jgi:hypothetical protein
LIGPVSNDMASTEPLPLPENIDVTPEEIKLGYLLLQYLRVSARDRTVHKFNVIGRSTRGEFEMWLRRDIPPDEKRTLIWLWDELKRSRLINATGTDLVNPDDWVIVSPKGLTITESEFAAMFSEEAHESRDTLHDMPEKRPATDSGLLVFISHSSKDADFALALIDLLKAGLALTADQIRCSSVDGYRLPVGVNTEGKLREEVNAAKVVIGLITTSSLASYYVMFELGARWGANLFLAPLLAGVKASELSGPLGLLNALSASNEAQLHQLLEDISRHLGLRLQPAASYVRHVSGVKALVDAIANPATTQAAATALPKQKLKMTLSAEGTPPSQILKVVANRHVKVSRVEYMLSSEASMAGEDVSVDGETIEIPINDGSVLKLWNTPRPDRNNYDHSGPAKIAVTVSVDGETDQYILPVQMEFMMQNNTAYRKLVGSKTFYG